MARDLAPHCFVAGDFNAATADDNHYVKQLDFVDLGDFLHVNYRSKLDRVTCFSTTWQPKKLKEIGTKKIVDPEIPDHESVLISDHYGLVATFTH